MSKFKTKKIIFRTLIISALCVIFTALFISLSACGEDLKENKTVDANSNDIIHLEVGQPLVIDFSELETEYGDVKYKEAFKIADVTENSCGLKVDVSGDVVTFSARYKGTANISPRYKIGYTGKYSVLKTLKIVFYDKKEVSTPEDLKSMKDTHTKYELINDIDMSGVDWKPYDFKGWLFGNGFSIMNLSYTGQSGESRVGMFRTNYGIIDGISMTDFSVSVTGSSEYVGLVAGVNEGDLNKINVSGEINALDSDFVGGVVGCQFGVSKELKSAAKVLGCRGVGGIFGDVITNENKIQSNLTNTGEIEGYEWVGGVAGGASDVLNRNAKIATFNNLTNEGAVTGSFYVGGVIGYAVPTLVQHGNTAGKGGNNSYTSNMDVSIVNVKNKGVVKGVDYVGGIAGQFGLDNRAIMGITGEAVNNGEVSGTFYVGGLYGNASGFVVIGSNTATVSGMGRVGGIGGFISTAENCDNSGEIVIIGRYYDGFAYGGGIAGSANSLTKCSNSGVVTAAKGGSVGGVVGIINTTLADCINSGDVTTLDFAITGGVAGHMKGGTASNNSNSGKVSGVRETGGIFGAVTDTACTDLTNSGKVSGEGIVGGIAGSMHGGSMINVSNTGSLVEASSNSVGGIIGMITEATVKLEKLKSSASVTGRNNVGGVVGYSTSTTNIDGAECSAQAVTGENYVGGLLGNSDMTTLSNSMILRTVVTGKTYVGGLAGQAYAVISGTFRGTMAVEDAPINAERDAYVGGIGGKLTYANNCINYAQVSVLGKSRYVGGIAGYIIGTKSATDKLTASNTNKGEVSGYRYVGGIAGYADNGAFDKCANEGAVTGTTNVGGIAGSVYNLVIAGSCSNKSAITAENYAAGIFGSNTGGSKIVNCSNTGAVNCPSNSGKIYVGDTGV